MATKGIEANEIEIDDKFYSEENISVIKGINQLLDDLFNYFVEREEIIDCMAIACLSENHVIIIGPPGTGKSYLIESFVKGIEGYKVFSWQLTKFSPPEEIFGPYSISELKKDNLERMGKDKIQECDIAYIDEVFNANSSILNSLNSSMNERVYQGKKIPLKSLYGATNFTPEENVLVAFYDRFLFRFVVDKIHERENFKKMLNSKDFQPGKYGLTSDNIENLKTKLKDVDTTRIIEPLLKIWELLKLDGFDISDRRFKWSLKALQARAMIEGRAHCIEDDLQILSNILWSDKNDIPSIKAVILKSINPLIAEIQELFDQAIDIEKQTDPLDRKEDNEQIQENLDKLIIISKKMLKLSKTKDLTMKNKTSIKRIIDKIREIHKNILRDKLGMAVDLI